MLDALVIGAGPVGLACALEIQRCGLQVAIVEKGALVNSLIGYPTNMEFFSTPELLEIGGHAFPTSHYKPLREDALDYYQRVARTENLTVHLHEKVVSLSGEQGNFLVKTDVGEYATRNVVVATGFYDLPIFLNVPGENLPHVSHYYKEPYHHARQRIAIIGAKNSAAKAALALTRAGAQVTLLVRGPEISQSVKYWIRPDLLNRIAEGRITAHFSARIEEITPTAVHFTTPEGPGSTPADFVYALTGYVPDEALLGRLGVEPDPNDEARAPLFDPATHQTTRPGLFVAGTVCGGRATSRWFIENGRHHAQLIAQHLAGAS
jgi:thioredoxin reductase (NADPH)